MQQQSLRARVWMRALRMRVESVIRRLINAKKNNLPCNIFTQRQTVQAGKKILGLGGDFSTFDTPHKEKRSLLCS